MPDADGKLRGISVPNVPWHQDCRHNVERELREAVRAYEPDLRKLAEDDKIRSRPPRPINPRLGD